MQYIGYYRKSPGGNKTEQQLQDSLGIAAQQAAVRHYANGSLIAEYSDMVTGAEDSRPELLAAIKHTKETGATLLIAKLDRLSRNLTFISTLIDRGVLFLSIDMPNADELMTHIHGAFAQNERKRIGARVKEGLAAKVANDPSYKPGMNKAGTYNISQAASMMGAKAMKAKAAANDNNSKARAVIALMSGKSLVEMAAYLNRSGFKTSRGGTFGAEQVRRLLK